MKMIIDDEFIQPLREIALDGFFFCESQFRRLTK
jgi:hypothetical protein